MNIKKPQISPLPQATWFPYLAQSQKSRKNPGFKAFLSHL